MKDVCRGLPEVGTVSQGYTVEEAVSNLKEATELYLEEFPMEKFSKSLMTTFEAVAYCHSRLHDHFLLPFRILSSVFFIAIFCC
jgi:hypothetical protein